MTGREVTTEENKWILLTLLNELDAFCRRSGITYFLASGTLIGAVRHRGFIPWDDDVDVCMTRTEYERFLSLYAPSSGRFRLCHAGADKAYAFPYAKLTDTGTVLIEHVAKPYPLGVYLDIFPMDNLPGPYKKACACVRRIKRLLKIKEIKDMRLTRERGAAKNLVILLAKTAVCPIGRGALARRIGRAASKDKDRDTPYIGGLVNNCYGEREIFRREAFDEAVEMPFEGKTYPVPKMYDHILNTMYGDYMTPPPEEKRVSHHGYDCRYSGLANEGE